ncbi:MAG: hypothetical protein GC181_04720 [Bacteroidetes bacterium]|nr:hypothetical protein [Bacteroidota bacterium]
MLKKLPLFILIAMFVAPILLDSCKEKEDPTPTQTTDTTKKDTTPVVKITYNSDIKAILDKSCAISGCHNKNSSVGSLASYSDAVAFVSLGRILGAIKHQSGYSAMPEGSPKLADTTITKIEKWITDGTPES